MQQFIAENPGAALAIISILGSGLIGVGALYLSNIRDGGTQVERRLTKAIDKLEETMHEGMDKLAGIVDRMDQRHIELADNIYDRINDVDRRLTALRGEHDNRGDHCPGAMALKQMLADGSLHGHRRAGD
jgi:predicted PurR-regulated permease PerM